MSDSPYKIVDKATMGQAACVISGTIDGPFVDCGTVCHQVSPYNYINVPVFKDIARKALFMVDEGEMDEARGTIAELRGQVARLEAEIADADRFAQAIDVIESHDFTARRKKGPKPKVAV